MAEPIDEKLDASDNKEDWDGDDLELPDDFTDKKDGSEAGAESDTGETEDPAGETEALDELEAEELEMLTEDEEAESLPVDEAEELRQIRRAAMSLESAADAAGADEFVCSSCFLVKAGSQLADKRKKLCRDCA